MYTQKKISCICCNYYYKKFNCTKNLISIGDDKYLCFKCIKSAFEAMQKKELEEGKQSY